MCPRIIKISAILLILPFLAGGAQCAFVASSGSHSKDEEQRNGLVVIIRDGRLVDGPVEGVHFESGSLSEDCMPYEVFGLPLLVSTEVAEFGHGSPFDRAIRLGRRPSARCQIIACIGGCSFGSLPADSGRQGGWHPRRRAPRACVVTYGPGSGLPG